MRALRALARVCLREFFIVGGTLLVIAGGLAWADYRANQASPGNLGIKADPIGGDTQVPLLGIIGGTGQTNRANVTPQGRLEVDASGTTQPVVISAGTANIGDVDILTLPALPAGNNNIGDVDIASLPVVTASGSITALNGEVQISSSGSAAIAFQLTGSWTATVSFEGTIDGTNWVVTDFWPASGNSAQTTTSGNGVFLAASGGFQTVRVRASAFTSGTITVSARSAPATGKMLASLAGGSGGTSSNFGSAFPSAGTAAGFSDGTNMRPGLSLDLDSGAGTQYGQGVNLRRSASGGSTEMLGQTTSALSLPVVLPNDQDVEVVGEIAHDAVDSGNPQKIGGKAVTADPTAVAGNDRVNAQFDTLGVLTARGYRHDVLVDGRATSTGTGDTSVIAAPGAGRRLYIQWIAVDNQNATTNSHVNAKCGTTIKASFPAPANGGTVIALPAPIRCGDNEAFQFASVTGVTTMVVAAGGYSAGN